MLSNAAERSNKTKITPRFCCIWICYIYVMYHFRTEVTLLRNNKRKSVGFGAAICFVVL